MATNLGGWTTNVTVGSMPQEVATAFANLNLVGAEYTPIAYLGSQIVNGTNHAILAEQLLITGKDSKNVVLMIFNQKGTTVDLVNIERVVESGAQMGGTQVAVQTEIPADAKAAFVACFKDRIGVDVKPFALLATQVVKGVNYVFACEVTPVTDQPQKSVELVTCNMLIKQAAFTPLLVSKLQMSLGCPLGDWP